MDHKLQIILAAKDISGAALTKFKGRLGGLAKSVLSLRSAIGTLTGAAGIGYLVKSSLSAADAIGKAADVAGVHTRVLQEYQHAANLSGVSTELLNSSLLAFNKRLGEAQANTGPLVSYLKKVDKQFLAQIQSADGTAAALKLVFDRMGRITNAADRAALANAAFSRSGVKLTVMAKGGAAGLAAMRAEAQSLGRVIKDSLIRGSEAANDKLDILGLVLKTRITETVIALAPEITRVAGNMLDWVKANQELITQDVAQTFSAMATAINSVAKAYQAVNDFLKVDKPESYLGEYAGNLEQTLKAQQSQLDMFKRLGSEGSKAYQDLNQRISLNIELLKIAKSELSDRDRSNIPPLPGAGSGPSTPAPGAVGGGIEVPVGRFSPRADRGRWAPRAGGMVGTVEAEKKQLAQIEAATVETYDSMDAHVTAYYDNVAAQAEKTAARIDYMADRMAGAVADFARSGKFSFTDFAESVINDIIRIQARGLFTDLLSSVAISGAGVAEAKGGVYDASGRTRFAAGGIVNRPTVFPFAGGMGLMGEAGPEAILPLTRTAGGELGVKSAGAGAADVQVIINNQSGSPATVKRQTDADGLRRLIIDIAATDVINGGRLAKANEMVYSLSRRGRAV